MRISWTDRLPLLIALGLVTQMAFMLYAYSAGYFERLEAWVYDIDGNPEELLASASDNKIRLWQQRRCITTLVSSQDVIRCLSLSTDGAVLASGALDHSILLWSVSQARPIRRLVGHQGSVTQVYISPDQEWLLSQGMDSTLCIWQLPTAKLIKRLPARNTGFSLSPSGELAYCDRQANLMVIDLKTQAVLWQLPQVLGKPQFSPTGDQLAWIDTASHCSVYNPLTHQRIITFSLGAHANWNIRFTPDSKQLLATKWGGAIELWNWRQAKRLTQFYAYTLASVEDLRFDEVGRLQTAGNGSIKYWDLSSQRLLFSIGDGAYRKVLLGWLSFWLVLTLTVSYVILGSATDLTYARYTIMGILTLWSLGLLLVVDQVRSWLLSWGLGGLWVMVGLTLLSFLLYYFAFISLVTIPIGLYFGYVYLLKPSPASWSNSLLPLVILLASTFYVISSLDDILYYLFG
jgi:WD40 repeat protein